jgi:single-strand DNA-binding protein
MTIVGSAGSDAKLEFTPSGVAKATVNVAVTPRTKRGEEWVDGETNWYRCTAWRGMAEQVAETVTKGMRLIVHGRFKARSWEKDGQPRTSLEIDVEEIGPSLRYATARIQKMERSSVGGASGGSSAASGDDPWSSSKPAGGKSGFDDTPPF